MTDRDDKYTEVTCRILAQHCLDMENVGFEPADILRALESGADMYRERLAEGPTPGAPVKGEMDKMINEFLASIGSKATVKQVTPIPVSDKDNCDCGACQLRRRLGIPKDAADFI